MTTDKQTLRDQIESAVLGYTKGRVTHHSGAEWNAMSDQLLQLFQDWALSCVREEDDYIYNPEDVPTVIQTVRDRILAATDPKVADSRPLEKGGEE